MLVESIVVVVHVTVSLVRVVLEQLGRIRRDDRLHQLGRRRRELIAVSKLVVACAIATIAVAQENSAIGICGLLGVREVSVGL